MYSFSYLEPVCCFMFSSNCCFLTCIQVSQEAGQVVCISHLFQNFPQFIVIPTVKGFGIVNKAEIDVFLELSSFSHDPSPKFCTVAAMQLQEWMTLLLLLSSSVMSNSLWLYRLQHTRLPCPLPSPGVCSSSCPLSQWCHLTISSSVVPFFSCLQSFPASGSFQMSQLFTSGGQRILSGIKKGISWY